jgi:hypothetical protein
MNWASAHRKIGRRDDWKIYFCTPHFRGIGFGGVGLEVAEEIEAANDKINELPEVERKALHVWFMDSINRADRLTLEFGATR